MKKLRMLLRIVVSKRSIIKVLPNFFINHLKSKIISLNFYKKSSLSSIYKSSYVIAIPSALQGEDELEAAVRELKEETGLSGEMKEIGRAVRHDHHSFYVVYLCEADFEKDSIVLQEGETIGYKWVDKETMFKLDGNELASSRTLEIVKKLDL